MDLLGDIGTNDQLIATRSENEILKQTVTKLSQQVQDLTWQLTRAQAEIDVYRNDGLTTTNTTITNTNTNTTSNLNHVTSSAMGILPHNSSEAQLIGIDNVIKNSMNYCHIPKYILSNLHDNSNPICVSMMVTNTDDDSDDSSSNITIVTGGADATLRWTRYGSQNNHNNPNTTTTTTTITYDALTAPVVCMTTISKEIKRYGNLILSQPNTNIFDTYIVVGTMDGHVTLLHFVDDMENEQYPSPKIVMDDSSSLLQQSTEERDVVLKKHDKYISSISWIYVDDNELSQNGSSTTTSWLATSSADGTIHIYTVTTVLGTADHTPPQVVKVQHIESFYFDHPVTSICYAKDLTNNGMVVLYVYVRNTPHIKVIHMPSFMLMMTENSGSGGCHLSTELHLNTSMYDTHVSFAVLDIKMSYDYKYMAVACDNHCHLIIENNCIFDTDVGTVRNMTTTTNNNNSPSIQKANILRKLYGHVADSYSRPIVAWSSNNQYIYCNTQNDTKLCIYSMASGKLLEDHNHSHQPDHHNTDTDNDEQQQLEQRHVRPIKYLCSHPYKNILVTTSFDRKTIVWTPQHRK